MGAGSEPRNAVLERIQDSLHHAEIHASNLRRRSSRFVCVNLVAGALGTIVAGLAAAFGPMAGRGPEAWKITCGAVALLTGCATLFSGLSQQLGLPDRLARATACAGRLRALEIDATLANRDLGEVAKGYEEVVANYQEFISR